MEIHKLTFDDILVKQEVSEDTCKTEIDNEVDKALFDTFKIEVNEEPKREITDGAFEYLVLKEKPIKTEIEQDKDKLELFEEKQKDEKSFFREDIQNDVNKLIKDHVTNTTLDQVLTAPAVVNTEIYVTCEICDKLFSIKNPLKLDVSGNTEKTNFRCKICIKNLKSQVKTYTTEKKNLTCDLELNTRKNHFKCEFCSKLFPYESILKKHRIIHTGEKPFTCTICSKLFSLKYNLNMHMRIHTGDKPFTCEICSKSFSQKNHAKQHIGIHTGEKPFVCEICSKLFSQKHSLKTHLRIHTGEKPFACDICSKSFSREHILKTHLRRHT
ncbi:uncharacterized protein [Diabrotica undecimpunctata]|uniref:uncharacterized protein isoform X2 n=1 Tax=Diabrotica undecimpunctata TaxID=50387 RepID=UPI003B63AAD4